MSFQDLNSIYRTGYPGSDVASQNSGLGFSAQVPYGFNQPINYGQIYPTQTVNPFHAAAFGYNNVFPQNYGMPTCNVPYGWPQNMQNVPYGVNNNFGNLPFQSMNPMWNSMACAMPGFQTTGYCGPTWTPFATTMNPTHGTWGFNGICR